MEISKTRELGSEVFDERSINPSQLGVSSRQINYWIDNKIVPFVSKQQIYNGKEHSSDENNMIKTKWIRLNMAQAVWVSIVKELFCLKVPMSAIQELAYEIWQRPREEHYADNVFEFHIKNNPNRLSKEEINKLKMFLVDELLMENYFRTMMNPFTDMVKSAMYRDEIPHTLLYVPKTNDYDFRYGDNSLIIDLGSVFLQNPMLAIPIVPILSKVVLLDFHSKERKDLKYLTDIEKEILDLVMFKKPKSVVIAFDDNQITPIKITETHKSREQLAEFILRHKIEKGSKLLIDIRSSEDYKITLIKKTQK